MCAVQSGRYGRIGEQHRAINAQSAAPGRNGPVTAQCGPLPCGDVGATLRAVSAPGPPDDRLDSWKEIAAYLRRDITTVQRWERREGMPVHRHLHDKAGSVHAFRSELDAWAARRTAAPAPEAATDVTTEADAPMPARAPRRRAYAGAAILAVLVVAGVLWSAVRRDAARPDPLAGARFVPLTDFDGDEHSAAVSRDGTFVAFLSDRDGRMDVWVTQVGGGRFYNVTKGTVGELVNPSVRTLGFVPDGTQVTFWTRTARSGGRPAIDIWAAPVLGGAPAPYLEGAAEFDTSPDGSRLVYHTPGPGDPMFVRDGAGEARRIFSAPPGLHAHFPTWSPDGEHIYFVQGTVPDRMDIWRLRPDGTGVERITHHDAKVSHPVMLDARRVLYLSTDAGGAGPWIHVVDVERRTSARVSPGLDRYTSLSASADGQTLAATRSDRKTTLWRVPFDPERIDAAGASRITLAAGTGRSPRLGPDYLVYVASRPDGDSLWKQDDAGSAELWRSSVGRIVGAPAISRDGDRIAFTVRGADGTTLYTVGRDGTNTRAVARGLELHGTPAWSPGDASLTVGVVVDGAPRLLDVPLDGTAPTTIVAEHATDPAWSSDGGLLFYSGADIGTTFEVKARRRGGGAPAMPALTLSRGSRHLGFTDGGRSLVVLRGDIGHKDLWTIDLVTGAERRLTAFPTDFAVQDFALSPDGRTLVLERLQEHSDIVLIQRGG